MSTSLTPDPHETTPPSSPPQTLPTFTDSDLLSEEQDKVRPLFVVNKKRKKKERYTYSNPNQKMKQQLEVRRNQNVLMRIFGPLQGGSLRAVVLYWIRMTMGIGIMSLPFYVKELGLLCGLILIVFCGLLTLISCNYLFDAQVETGKKYMIDISRSYIPKWMVKIFSWSLIIDLFSSLLIYSVVSWNLFEFLLYTFGLYKQEWIADEDKVQFHEYNPQLLLIRVAFFHIIFIAMIPMLLKHDLESMRFVSFGFILVLFIILIIILAQCPEFFWEYHREKGRKHTTVEYFFKKFWTPKFFTIFYSVLLAFYVQPYIMSLRKELLIPSKRRLKKVGQISITSEIILFTVIGGICYWVFGDEYTTPLIILRKPMEHLPGFEWVFRVFLIFFFIFNTMGIPVFNVPLRDVIVRKFIQDDEGLGFLFCQSFSFQICF